MEIIEDLLKKKPFEFKQVEKEELFLKTMKDSLKYHYNNCELFKKFIDSQEFDITSEYKIEDIPFLPTSLFKKLNLITGKKESIRKNIFSSSTSEGKPSSIFLDATTINRQRTALVSILSNFFGNERRVFFIFDTKLTILNHGGKISSRASAIRGMSPIAKSIHFLLDEDLRLDLNLFKEAVNSLIPNDKLCFFGFTWIVYKMFLQLKSDKNVSLELNKEIDKIRNEKMMLHIGGWKKLQDISIDKHKFNEDIGLLLGISPSKISDFYGMAEQLGTVYPDCEFGYKHVPLYSEIIIRDLENFKPCPIGKTGFIQLLSPLPNSYPGISIIADDLGEIKGVDDCKCGRKGKYFVFKKRAEKAEIKGCGDTYDE